MTDPVGFDRRSRPWRQGAQPPCSCQSRAHRQQRSGGKRRGTRLAHRATVPSGAMPTTDRTWEQRLERILMVLLWGSFALGFLLSAIRNGAPPAVTISAFIAGAYAVVMQWLPRRWRLDENIGELIAVCRGRHRADCGGSDRRRQQSLPAVPLCAVVLCGRLPGFPGRRRNGRLTSMGLIFVVATLQQEIIQGQVLQVSLLYLAHGRRLCPEPADLWSRSRLAAMPSRRPPQSPRFDWSASRRPTAHSPASPTSQPRPSSTRFPSVRRRCGTLHSRFPMTPVRSY